MSNLGATSLNRRRRARDPMREFDRLPPHLRQWLAQATLPWSPASCRKIWRAAEAEGASVGDVLARLERAEQKTLARIGHSESRLPRQDQLRRRKDML